jgi:hypothetical protein
MDAAILLSGFSGLLAAFVASALWATRPTALTGTARRRVAEHVQVRASQRR